MKKITYLFLTIFAAAMLSSCVVIGLDDVTYPHSSNRTSSTTSGSSTSSSSTSTSTHTSTNTSTNSRHAVTCYNQTSYTITDWCVKKDNQVTFANSTCNRMIVPNAHDSITNLPVGRYQIFFSFDNCYQLQPCNYTGSEEFYLDRDINYILSERYISYNSNNVCKNRSAGSEYPVFVLQGSDGSEIELYPTE
jgi:hypothetical protein